MSACPVCGEGALAWFLTRDRVPVHQNLVMATREDAVAIPRGDLTMHVCHACGFVTNTAFDASLLAYGADYDNTQGHSPVFAAHMDDRVRHLIDHEGVRDARIVEVGCGRGAFLRRLVADPSWGNTGCGFDPSYVGPSEDLEGRLRFERRLYDASCVTTPADVVISRHVIEHVPRPLEMLAAIGTALRRAATGRSGRRPRLYFETPCVEWILRGRVVWDLFYEHCSLFTRSSLHTLFTRAGFTVLGVDHVFGGQYLWLEAEAEAEAADGESAPAPAAGEVPALAAGLGRIERDLRVTLAERVETLRADGPVAVWGAGAKGATLANLVDPRCTRIDCVVDTNPAKQGRFIAGTGHPIVAPDALASRGVAHALLMNENYREECRQLLDAAGVRSRLAAWTPDAAGAGLPESALDAPANTGHGIV